MITKPVADEFKIEVSGVLIVKDVFKYDEAVDKIINALNDAGIAIKPDKKFVLTCIG